jgi:hypothetical protein
MKLKKIPLEDLLDVLEELYDLGVDYVDILGEVSTTEEKGDVIGVSFTQEYVNEDFKENFPIEPIELTGLTDDNINDLI